MSIALRLACVIASLIAVTFSASLKAGSLVLHFDSLPSAQGMTADVLSFTGATESDVFSVDGEKLVIDTVGKKTLAHYRWDNSFDLQKPISLRVDMRLDELVPDITATASPRDVFRFLMGAGGRYYGFSHTYHGFNSADPAKFHIETEDGSDTLVPGIDVFSRHEYRIDANPVSGAFTFSVDGATIRTEYGRPLDASFLPLELNFFVMGGIGHSCDTCDLGSRLSVYGLQVSQVPEPSSAEFMLSAMGVVGTVVALRKRRPPGQLV